MRTILHLPPQASSIAREVDLLHYFVISVTMLGAMVVAVAAVVLVIRYRERPGQEVPTSSVDEAAASRPPLWLELSVIGVLLILFTGWWIIGFRQYTRIERPPSDALDVYVVAKKWMWTFAYPDGGTSNGVLYAPVGRPVRLVMTSRDVIHSFYVPAFRIKQDVVPGRVTTAWFEAVEEGEYALLCAEYCGTGHSTMRARVAVVSADEYARHLEAMPRIEVVEAEYRDPALPASSPRDELSMAEMGQRVASEKGCLRCHTVDGTPHVGPTWARLYESKVQLLSGAVVVADAAYLTESMMDPRVRVRAGFATVMPSYQGLLSAAQAGAIVEYIRSLRDVPLAATQAPLAPPESRSGPAQLPRASGGEPDAQQRWEATP